MMDDVYKIDIFLCYSNFFTHQSISIEDYIRNVN